MCVGNDISFGFWKNAEHITKNKELNKKGEQYAMCDITLTKPFLEEQIYVIDINYDTVF